MPPHEEPPLHAGASLPACALQRQQSLANQLHQQLQNSAYQPQIKRHLFAVASGQKVKVPPARRAVVVDQDMVDWSDELFGKETLLPPPIQPNRPDIVPEGREPRSYSLRDTEDKSLDMKDEDLVINLLKGDNPA